MKIDRFKLNHFFFGYPFPNENFVSPKFVCPSLKQDSQTGIMHESNCCRLPQILQRQRPLMDGIGETQMKRH
ncbi:MAG: hypothetical protein LBT76_02745 [Tannerella sp.]|jgi:hypothetical protein|nr:hypothetical protein [Tannerella sp.]